jgi:hypothetical protein
MQIVTSNEVDDGIRLAAAIYIKKLTAVNWSKYEDEDEEDYDIPQEDAFFLPEEDKSVLRQNIVEMLIRSPPKLRLEKIKEEEEEKKKTSTFFFSVCH